MLVQVDHFLIVDRQFLIRIESNEDVPEFSLQSFCIFGSSLELGNAQNEIGICRYILSKDDVFVFGLQFGY